MISRWIGWHEVPIGRQPQPLPALEDLLVFCGLQDVHFVGDNSSDAPPCKFKMKPENYRWHLFEDEKSCANTLMFELNMWVFWGLLRVYEKLYVQDKTGWWFQMFYIFIPTWRNDPIWLIFFKGVEATNQKMNKISALLVFLTTKNQAQKVPWKLHGCSNFPAGFLWG